MKVTHIYTFIIDHLEDPLRYKVEGRKLLISWGHWPEITTLMAHFIQAFCPFILYVSAL